MDFFVSEQPAGLFDERTAGTKARRDIDEIARSLDFCELTAVCRISNAERRGSGKLHKVKTHLEAKRDWEKVFSELRSGDRVLIQYPVINHTLFMPSVFKKLVKRGVCVILLVHDLDVLRTSKLSSESSETNARRYAEEFGCLKAAGFVICHNEKMKSVLSKAGVPSNRLVSLGLFDYLTGMNKGVSVRCKEQERTSTAVAGNLDPQKSGYVYALPNNVNFELYGVNLAEDKLAFTDNIEYKGSYSPEELPDVIEGDFGLVWDGPSPRTCEGAFGEYLKVNDPHKTSLYLAAGMPVICWSEAAVADEICRRGCGLTVDSLDSLADVIAGITPEMYREMAVNAAQTGELLRRGYFTREALNHCK